MIKTDLILQLMIIMQMYDKQRLYWPLALSNIYYLSPALDLIVLSLAWQPKQYNFLWGHERSWSSMWSGFMSAHHHPIPVVVGEGGRQGRRNDKSPQLRDMIVRLWAGTRWDKNINLIERREIKKREASVEKIMFFYILI